MSQMGRAPNEVAKHFYKKYGYREAIEIISARINSDGAREDTNFWADVMKIIQNLEAASPKTEGIQHYKDDPVNSVKRS